MIHRDRSWPLFFTKDSIEGSADRLTRYQNTSLSHRTLSTPVINDCEHSKRPPIGQGIMDTIHPLPLGRFRWGGSRSSVQDHMCSPQHPHAQLQSFEPVQPAHSFPIHPPAFATQEHPDARISSPRCRKSHHSPRAAGRGRRWRCRLRPGESRTGSAPPRTSTASWVRSFRRGPPKLPSYSSLKLPSFSGETS